MGTLLTYYGKKIIVLTIVVAQIFHVVGPCHHGMARPQVEDRGTASDKVGSCE